MHEFPLSLMPNLAPCVSPLSVAEVIVARSAKLVVFEHPNARAATVGIHPEPIL